MRGNSQLTNCYFFSRTQFGQLESPGIGRAGQARLTHFFKRQVTACSFPGKGSYPTSQRDELGLPDELFPGIFLGNAGFFDLIFLKTVSVLVERLAQHHVPEEVSFLPAARMGEQRGGKLRS